MTPTEELKDRLVAFLRENKPALKLLEIPAYIDRLLAFVDEAGFKVRRKPLGAFLPKSLEAKQREYTQWILLWKAGFHPEHWERAFPGLDILLNMEQAVIWMQSAFPGRKIKRFDQFFTNWCARNFQKLPTGSAALKPDLSPREKLIYDGLKTLSLSRSERIEKADFSIRFGAACEDLKEIPDAHLAEVFRRARSLEIKSVPNTAHLMACYRSLIAQLNRVNDDSKKVAEELVRDVDAEQWKTMTDAERQEHMKNSLTPEQWDAYQNSRFKLTP